MSSAEDKQAPGASPADEGVPVDIGDTEFTTPSRVTPVPDGKLDELPFRSLPTASTDRADGADDGALVMTQESYGPIAAVRRVRDDAEALAVFGPRDGRGPE